MPRSTGLFSLWVVAIALAATGFVVASKYVRPAPPKNIVMATGSVDGAYHAWGMRLADALAEDRIELTLRPTAGSNENLALLAAGEVDLALAQGGTRTDDPDLRSLASLFFEPVWIFHRTEVVPEGLADLTSLRTSIGPEGSGTRALLLELLALNGLEGRELGDLTTTAAADALLAGELDAAVFVASERAAILDRLMTSDELQLLDLDRAPAYHLQRRFIAAVILPEGAIDLARNVPPAAVDLAAVAANLVADDSLHPALVDLVLLKASRLDEDSLFAPRGTFPSPRHVSLPLDEGAEIFHEQGPSFLQRVLPFWAATLINRAIVLLLPLVALIIPMAKAFPPLYRWRVRSRIYRWYDDLQALERASREGADAAPLVARADAIESEVDQVATPLSYADELYDLKLHIDFVRRRIRSR
ncbi:MAG: TAXI family TRAP transporter solute-binding subunit [Pseudomonadota bacterium]